MADIYPCTIVLDRYGGGYSKGLWLAWPCDPEQIPDEPESDDVRCMTFWETKIVLVGKGDTPDAALRDLETLLREPLAQAEHLRNRTPPRA